MESDPRFVAIGFCCYGVGDTERQAVERCVSLYPAFASRGGTGVPVTLYRVWGEFEVDDLGVLRAVRIERVGERWGEAKRLRNRKSSQWRTR